MTASSANMVRSLAWLLAALVLYAVALSLIATPLDLEQYRAVFSERGPFERLSPLFWLLLWLATWVAAWRLPRATRWNLATVGCVALLFAMRELDWHYKLAGGNVLRIKFYQHNPASPEVKIIAAIVVLAGLAVLCRTLYLAFRHLRQRGSYSERWTWTMLVAVAVGLGTKMLDRTISLAGEWFGTRFAESTGQLIGAYEEGFECALPLIFALALVQYRFPPPLMAARTRVAGPSAARDRQTTGPVLRSS